MADQGGRVVGRIIGLPPHEVELPPLTRIPEVETPFAEARDDSDRYPNQDEGGRESEEPAMRTLVHAAQNAQDTLIVIASWKTWLQAQYAEATVRHYLASVMAFFMAHPLTVQQVTEDHIVAFLQKYSKRPAIRRARYQGLKSFFDWCERRHVIDRSPTDGLKIPHPQQRVPRGMTKEEVSRVVAAAYARAPHRGATLEVLYYTACRVGEAVTIRWEDITEDQLVLHGHKSKKDRIVDMTPELRKALEVLWEWSGKAGHEYAIPRSKATVWGWCRAAGQDSGIDRVHPHLFRSSSATIMNEAGASAFAIQTALGHSKVATTMRYIAVRDEDRRAAFESLAL